MTREKAKQLLPVIQAYAEGKIIQTKRLDGTWIDFEPQISKDIGINFENGEHRIKPDYCEKLEIDLESQSLENKDFVYDYNNQHTKSYQPFKNCDELVECWERKIFIPAMQYTKQKVLFRPEIWVKNKNDNTERLIVTFGEDFVKVGSKTKPISLYVLFSDYEFLDGTPCGIAE